MGWEPRIIRFLKEITQQKKSNFFLSETLVKENKIKSLCRQLNFAEYCSIDVRGHSGGLALLWRNEGGCKITEVTRHFIDFEVDNIQVGRWRYTGFYGCAERERRRESWDLLRSLAGKSNLPWCIFGDFNDMMYTYEKRRGKEHPRRPFEGFTATVRDCGLSDLGFIGEKFTSEKSRGQHNWVQERLDRCLAYQE